MANEYEGERSRRRYPRATGPFEGLLDGPVLIYDLNVGGGFINSEQRPEIGSRLPLKISLPEAGVVNVTAEPLYQHEHGFAVQFVDLDEDTASRIARTVDTFSRRRF